MLIFFILFIICPDSNDKDILNYLNSLKSEEEIYLSIKNCPFVFLIKEGISRLNDEKYINEIAKGGDWYFKYLVIPKIKDENLLKDIYQNEDDKLLKEEAIKYIKDQDFLKNALKKDGNIMALKNLKDESFLKELVLKEKEKEIKEKALFFIENPLILKEILKELNDDDLREIVFLKLKNSNYIREILNEDFSKDIKIESLSYAEEGLLKEMVLEEDFPFKKEALENIKDQNFLKKIFNLSEESFLKASALLNIKDEEFLKKIFSEMPELVEYTLKNIQDENFLIKNFYELKENLKEIVLLKIKDQEFLKKVFFESKNEKIKEAAIKRIYQREFLKKIYFNLNSQEQKKSVLYNLKREDQDFYKKVVLKEKNKYLKAEALKFIEDEIFIKDIILKEKSIYLKLEGMKRLANQEILKEIFNKEKEWFIKLNALEKIKDRNFLKNSENNWLLDEIEKKVEIKDNLPYEDICVNLKEENFEDLKVLKKIIKDLGDEFIMDYKASCKERRYFQEEEKLYPPDRGKVYQLKIKFKIIDRSSNFNKIYEFSGKHLSKRENFEKNCGKINGYYVKYYLPEINFLEFTKEIIKDSGKEKFLNYLNSENKYIKAAALILKSEMEAK